MKSSQSFFDEFAYYITPSELIEFNYCKRFIYYMKCLNIPQFEEKRFKVQKGKEIHHTRSSNLVKEFDVEEKDISKLKKSIKEYFKVMEGFFPKATTSKSRCIDCCYKNICIK